MWNAGFPPPNTYIRSKLSLWRSSPAHVPAQWSTQTTLKSCTLCNPMASAVTCIAVSFSESCLQQAPSPAPSVSSGPGLISAQIALVLEFIQFLCSHSMFVFAFSLCSVQPDLSGSYRACSVACVKMLAHVPKMGAEMRVCLHFFVRKSNALGAGNSPLQSASRSVHKYLNLEYDACSEEMLHSGNVVRACDVISLYDLNQDPNLR